MTEHGFLQAIGNSLGLSRRRARAASLAAILAATLLVGCTERSITVSDADLEMPERTTSSLTDSSAAVRDVYYADDEAVTLEVEFDVNFVAVYKSFYAWWYFPNGRIYLRQPVRNKFGSHLALVTSMPIRGEPPASWPGTWRVQLTLRDRTLLEQTFEIRPGTRPPGNEAAQPDGAVPAESGAASAALVLCPDPGSPSGTCGWEAPEEGWGGEAYLERLLAPAAPARLAESPPPSPPPAARAAPVATTSGGAEPARVSPRSGTVAASIPASVLEAAERARAARDQAALAARSPPPTPPPPPPSVQPGAPAPEPGPGTGEGVGAGIDTQAETGSDTDFDADTPERAWGAGRAGPPSQPASAPRPGTLAVAGATGDARPCPTADAAGACGPEARDSSGSPGGATPEATAAARIAPDTGQAPEE